jgi:hypothetical protein
MPRSFAGVPPRIAGCGARAAGAGKRGEADDLAVKQGRL